MSHSLVYLLTSLLAYLVGAIPFGYLIFLAVRGVDIRTVGSGNIGATNVGRNLGFRYFVLVFTLDMLKGWLPTYGLPRLLGSVGAEPPADLGVFVALATILGHNFPAYLKFKGGKGVATSLGALLALDPVACGAATLAFFAIFLPCRIVSLASMSGGLAFVATHFARTVDPWSRENRAMSILSIAIFALLVVRHRQNIVRLLRGTEPRVVLRKPGQQSQPSAHSSGKIRPSLVLILAGLTITLTAAGYSLISHASASITLNAGPWALRETHREATGQQRSTRVVFADRGRILAVMCPRYNKVLLYRVTAASTLKAAGEIPLDGRPVAIAAVGTHLVVLERPTNDDKHLKPGWWEAFRLDGTRAGSRVPAGYYADDLAATPDGRFFLVLSSGQAEGDPDKPLPALEVFASEFDRPATAPVGRLFLDPTEDPDRLSISATGARAIVTVKRSSKGVAVDLLDPAAPRVAGHADIADAEAPYVSFSPDGDWIVMPCLKETEAVAIPAANATTAVSGNALPRDSAGYLACTLPDDSSIEIFQARPSRSLGQFPLKGPFNLGGTRPAGIAFSPDRGLLAVTTKPGTVHLIELRSRLSPTPENDRMVLSSEATKRP